MVITYATGDGSQFVAFGFEYGEYDARHQIIKLSNKKIPIHKIGVFLCLYPRLQQYKNISIYLSSQISIDIYFKNDYYN